MMEHNNTRKEAKARAIYETTRNASTDSDDELGDEATIFPVPSTKLRRGPSAGLVSPLSHRSKQQDSTREGKVQQSSPSAALKSPVQSMPRLAVQIRSSASPSHIRQNPVLKGDQALRPKSPQNPTESKSPVALPPVKSETKRRGRPKGWKPGMSYIDTKQISDGNAQQSKSKRPADPPRESKRRGRPLHARERYLQTNPTYMPFLCEWHYRGGKRCPAELQNLMTLVKHVRLLHSTVKPPTCAWGKCGLGGSLVCFGTKEELQDHLLKEHILPITWYRGEGYQNKGISKLKADRLKPPSYLFDESGKQVTPWSAKLIIEDDQQRKERIRKLERFLIQQDENAPDDEEYTKQTLGIQ
ncbi:uncharacterized protein GGS25DRAFT_481276 [Hypoxylon fragiforme]|uniref:uncharacterized protein n=1 Tax=Hypoxylon fragiforme TaxID=63214 RepID=UPI0020C65B07|nr:uncharacterized protein GGS25DRAFT_481276 [Hypoxylon fragiforme]KAI2611071.1 hypothetical protein GGS25DRAFT_481276 [Hypoxylon fragiforme]